MNLRSLLHRESNGIVGAAFIVSTATFANKIVGVMRDRMLAHQFGAGSVMDTYYAAFKIPDTIYNLLVVGALTAGFIPVFSRLFFSTTEKHHSAAWKLVNNLLNILGALLAVAAIFGAIFARQLSPLIAPGFSPEQLRLTENLIRVLFFSPLLLGISMVFGGVLQSLKRFVIYSVAPIFYNLGIIVGAALFAPLMGPIGLGWGVLLGATLHALLQAYGVRQAGFRWRPEFTWRDPELRAVLKLMAPRTLALGITSITGIIITMLASRLPTGSVSAYNFADNLQWVPIGVIGIPLAVAAFPTFTEAIAKNNLETFRSELAKTIRVILFLVTPVAIIFLLLRAQIVRTILGTGAFDWNATITTADVMACFAAGIFAQALIPLLARAFYALHDSTTPLIAGIIGALATFIFATKIPLAALVVHFFHFPEIAPIANLALAITIGAIVNAVILYITIRHRLKKLDEQKIWRTLATIGGAGLAMMIIVQYIKYPLAFIFDQRYWAGIAGQGITAGFFGLAIYMLICYSVKLPELLDFIAPIQKKFRRKTPENSEIVDPR